MAKRKNEVREDVVSPVPETEQGTFQAVPAVYDPVNYPEGAKMADRWATGEPVERTPDVKTLPNGITVINW